ncbi:unnamed protein product [Callosobruchus maculatus]|uniref:Regulatory protein zeste n=1 Tax=Callosobruchus maculatus TaxID=64391 RepID=A0A653CBL0_CALMS|nr:unnamed protein product [Callosobruchus maculatus]
MLTFFEAHPDLSHGRLKGLNARERAKQLWAELSQKLNSLGFGERSVDKWQKVAEKENEKFRASDINQIEDVLSLVLSVDESQPGSSNPASTPKTNKRIIDHDHDYGMGSAKKVKKTNIEDAYIETIEVLKEIKNCLHAGLADIKDSLGGIRSAIEKNQANT